MGRLLANMRLKMGQKRSAMSSSGKKHRSLDQPNIVAKLGSLYSLLWSALVVIVCIFLFLPRAFGKEADTANSALSNYVGLLQSQFAAVELEFEEIKRFREVKQSATTTRVIASLCTVKQQADSFIYLRFPTNAISNTNAHIASTAYGVISNGFWSKLPNGQIAFFDNIYGQSLNADNTANTRSVILEQIRAVMLFGMPMLSDTPPQWEAGGFKALRADGKLLAGDIRMLNGEEYVVQGTVEGLRGYSFTSLVKFKESFSTNFPATVDFSLTDPTGLELSGTHYSFRKCAFHKTPLPKQSFAPGLATTKNPVSQFVYASNKLFKVDTRTGVRQIVGGTVAPSVGLTHKHIAVWTGMLVLALCFIGFFRKKHQPNTDS